MDAIRGARLKLAVDPLGGAAVHYWEPINKIYGLDIAVVNPRVDPTFSFIPLTMTAPFGWTAPALMRWPVSSVSKTAIGLLLLMTRIPIVTALSRRARD